MLESILGLLNLIFHATIDTESMFYMVFFFLDIQAEVIFPDVISFILNTNNFKQLLPEFVLRKCLLFLLNFLFHGLKTPVIFIY